jgi:hypothetical protein
MHIIRLLLRKYNPVNARLSIYLVGLYLMSLSVANEPSSSVSTVSGYGLDDQAIKVRSPTEAKELFL